MSQPALLVSVRDASEAAAALAGGAGIIDVKEPSAGSLGMASRPTLKACGAVVPATVPWTLAGGELDDAGAAVDQLEACLPDWLRLPRVVKFGLSGWLDRDWVSQLLVQHERLPADVRAIPVAYADTEAARSPPVSTVIDDASRCDCPLVLVDTFDKNKSGSLLVEASVPEIKDWIAHGNALGVSLVLAGRIAAEEITLVAGCQPVAVAVRSAVCIGGRLGRINEKLVRDAATACEAAVPGCDAADIGKVLLKGDSV